MYVGTERERERKRERDRARVSVTRSAYFSPPCIFYIGSHLYSSLITVLVSAPITEEEEWPEHTAEKGRDGERTRMRMKRSRRDRRMRRRMRRKMMVMLLLV
jgi:hypothetical protein